MRPHRRQPTRLLHPWDFPGKNTGLGCHFLLQCMKVKSESEVSQLCQTVRDPMDCSLPGSSISGIFQARILEWVAISFSNTWKRKVKVKSLSRVRLFSTPWTAAYQAPPSMGVSRQEYWNGLPLLSPSCAAITNSILEQFHHLKRNPIPINTPHSWSPTLHLHYISQPHPLYSPTPAPDNHSPTFSLPILNSSFKWNPPYATFCVLHLLLFSVFSRLIHIAAGIRTSFIMNNILFYINTRMGLSVHLLLNIWVVSIRWLLWITLLGQKGQTVVSGGVFGHMV